MTQSGQFGIPPGCGGARRPEKRVHAKSKPPHQKCEGTAFPRKATAKALQHAIGLHEGTPPPPCRVAVVRGIRVIIRKWRRVGDLVRRRSYPNVDIECREHRPVFLIEVGDGLVLQPQASRFAGARPRQQEIAEKIEFHLDNATAVRHGRRCQSVRGDIERAMPPVILEWRQPEPRFADDLRPSMQRRVGRLPLLERQCRPHVLGSLASYRVGDHVFEPVALSCLKARPSCVGCQCLQLRCRSAE
jgi:hypothetical protein